MNHGNRIRNMIDLSKSEDGVTISSDVFDSDSNLLGVRNGIIDLTTFDFRKGRREEFITRYCGCDYDPVATCPSWTKFLVQIMKNNQDMISFLQRNDGFELTGLIDEKVRIHWGSGANGKSVYREVKRFVYGGYSDTASVALLLQTDKASAASPEMAKLKGYRHISINETREHAKYSEERLKNLASNEPISARPMYGDPITFMPTHKLEISTQHKPDVTAVDEGFWRRILLIPFTYTVPEKERNIKFREEYLMGELPGILNWMLDGLQDFYKQGLNPPIEVKNAIEEYRNEMDFVQQWVDDKCIKDTLARTSIDILYKDYEIYIKQDFGVRNPSIFKEKVRRRIG